MCKPTGGEPLETTEQKLDRREQEFRQARLAQRLQENEAETVFLERDAQGQLVTEEEAARERLRAAQPADAVQAPPQAQVAEAEGVAVVQEQRSWKERLTRQGWAGRLRGAAGAARANIQVGAEGQAVHRVAGPQHHRLDIDRVPDRVLREKDRMEAYQKAKLERDHAEADRMMAYYSRNMWKYMERGGGDRPGQPSGKDVLRELAETTKLTVMNDAAMKVDDVLEVLRLCDDGEAGTEEDMRLQKELQKEGYRVLGLANGVNQHRREYFFRERYVLPQLQSRGLRRNDMVDSLRRMEAEMNTMVPEVYRAVQDCLVKARKYIYKRSQELAEEEGSTRVSRIRGHMPDFDEEYMPQRNEAEEVSAAPAAEEEIVDLEEAEQELEAKAGTDDVELEEAKKTLDDGSGDDSIEEI